MQKEKPKRTERRRVHPAVAFFAGVVVGVGLMTVVMMNRSESETVPPPETTSFTGRDETLPVLDIAVTADGRTIAAAVQEANGKASIYLRDIQGTLLNPVAIELAKNIPIVNDLEFTRDGARLIASPDGSPDNHSVLSYNVSDKTSWNFVGDYAAVSAVGDYMAIVSGGKITFYNSQNGQLISQKRYTDPLGPVAFSPKLQMMAVLVQPAGGNSEVRFIPFANFSTPSYASEDFMPDGEFRDIVFTPQGDRIVAATKSGLLKHNIELDGATYGGGYDIGAIHRLAVVNDWLAVASDTGVHLSHYETRDGWTTLLWMAKGTLAGHQGAVTAVAFLPDGTHLLTGGVDGTVRLWDFINQTETWRVGAAADSQENFGS